MKRKKQSGVSFGTLFMLILTALVILGSVGFVLMIAGDDVVRHAEELVQSFSAQGFTMFESQMQSIGMQRMADGGDTAFFSQAPWAATPTPALTPTPAPQKTVLSIRAAGVVHAPKAVRQTVHAGGDAYDFMPIFETLGGALSDADLTVATLETVTAGSEQGYDNYNAPASLLDALRRSGVDLVSLATERALDKGGEGLDVTIREITGRGLSYVGAHLSGDSAERATMVSIGGVQVAVLAYSYGLSEEGKQSVGMKDAVATIDQEQMAIDIAQARLQGVELVIVLPHWGAKNKTETPESVRSLAAALAQAGADVILGTHPNVVQGVERLRVVRSDGLEYETVVCYSLGCLLTDARGEENTAGMIAALDVTYDPVTRRVSLGEVRCEPLYISRTGEGEEAIYRLVPVWDEDALAQLGAQERGAAMRAAQIVERATQEGQNP